MTLKRTLTLTAVLVTAAISGGSVSRGAPAFSAAITRGTGAAQRIAPLRIPAPYGTFLGDLFAVPGPLRAVSPAAQSVIDTALREVGVFENAPPNYCVNSGTNTGTRQCQPPGTIGSVNSYLAAAGIGPGNFWCMAFVTWVFKTAGYPLPTSTACVDAFVNYADTHGWAVDRSPEPGDVIVFQFGADSNDCFAGGSDFDHAGIVTKVYPDCSYDTVEGNSNNQVSQHHYEPGEGIVRLISVPGVTSSTSTTGCTVGGGGSGGGGENRGGAGGMNTHTTCQNNTCMRVPGKGINECDSNAECRPSHKTCRGFQCVVVPEPGRDTCASDEDCRLPAQTAAHRACLDAGLGPQCVLVRGAGGDECRTDRDCGLVQKEQLRKSVTQKEELLRCDSPGECRSSHLACRGLQCVRIPEPGTDECTRDADCANLSFRSVCRDFGLGGQCVLLRGSGPNTCTSDADCADRTENEGGGGVPPPPSTSTCTAESINGGCDELARRILNHPNINIYSSSGSCNADCGANSTQCRTTNPLAELRDLADSGCMNYLTGPGRSSANPCPNNPQCPDYARAGCSCQLQQLLQALLDYANAGGEFTITAIGGGTVHMCGSDHYAARAVDIVIENGRWSEAIAFFRRRVFVFDEYNGCGHDHLHLRVRTCGETGYALCG